jgi:hypothetical protein
VWWTLVLASGEVEVASQVGLLVLALEKWRWQQQACASIAHENQQGAHVAIVRSKTQLCG